MPIDPPPAITRPAPDRAVEQLARGFARMTLPAAEAILDARIAEAVHGWRLEDAAHWQKIKYKSRWMRGLASRAGARGDDGQEKQG